MNKLNSYNDKLYAYSKAKMMRQKKPQGQILTRLNETQRIKQQLDQASLKQYNINQLISLDQFVQLSNEIKVAAERRESLVNSLYMPTYVQKQFKFKRQEQAEVTHYKQLYETWKNEQSKNCTFDSTYKSTLALLDKQKRLSQFKRLINQSKIPQPIYKYQDQNFLLKNTSHLHQQRLNHTLNSQFNPKSQKNQQITSFQTQKSDFGPSFVNKQKSIEIAIQKQLLKRISQINKNKEMEQQRLLKEKEMEKRCYVDFIEKPFLARQKQKQKDIENNSKLKITKQPFFNDYTVQAKRTSSKPKDSSKKAQLRPAYKLNIQQMLKIKPKQFLIFYSDNYHQILRLAQPEQMKQLNQYRDQCLKKQQALSKLKQKVAQYGPQYIKKLDASTRHKLFRVLYQQDVEIQKSYNV